MERKLLELTPKRFLCPYCGEWHDWSGHKLAFYDLKCYQARLQCPSIPRGYNTGSYEIYFSNDYCYFSTKSVCERAHQSIDGKIPISSIIESVDKPIVTFEVPFTAKHDVGRYECPNCIYKGICNCVKLGDEGDNRHMTITFGFEFEQSEYNEFAKAAILTHKEKKLQKCEQAIDSKEQALKEREDTVASKEHVSQRSQVKENKEDTTMANNIFSMNMEFGLNKDENIASTLMGIAVKNGDSWRIYDKKKKEITDIGDMQLGNLPIFILPTTKLRDGDLIKDAGEYYFVTKVATSKTPTQTLSARTGEMKSIIPIKNVLGFSCYSKVITFSDSFNIGDDFDVEKLAIMSAICGQTGEGNNSQMNQLLPLMLFKDKLNGDDDMTKILLMSSMMTSEEDSGHMNQILPLILFKDKLGEDDDKLQLFLMSSMIGDNMASSNNPLMSYLMLDTFMSKKDDKTSQS